MTSSSDLGDALDAVIDLEAILTGSDGGNRVQAWSPISDADHGAFLRTITVLSAWIASVEERT